MYKNTVNFIKKYKLQLLIIGVSLLAYAIIVYAQRHFLTYDAAKIQVPWWNYMAEHGWSGIATLNADIKGDYTTIWYFVIFIFTKLQLYPYFPIEYSLKFLAVTFSLAAAVAVFFIARHFRPKSQYLPVIAASITPFLPVFSMDLLKSNLTDSIFIAFCLWSFYFFLKSKKELSWFLLAFGACFKLMAIYLIPVYLFFYIKDFKKYSLKEKLAPLWGLAAVVVCSIPNVLAGGKFFDGIITPILGRNDNGATMPWFWLMPPSNEFTAIGTGQEMKTMLYGLLLIFFFMTIFFMLKYVKKANQERVGLAIFPSLSILICFFLLPAQHETYFAMAAIFALIGFIAVPRKELFVNFLTINIFLFFMYLYGLTWWYKEPFWILPNTYMGIIFTGILIFNFYLLYKNSVFYKPKKV